MNSLLKRLFIKWAIESMQSGATMAKHYSIKQEIQLEEKQITIKDLKIIVNGCAKTEGDWRLKHKHMHTSSGL